jgi:hypothetical protein
LSLKGCLPTRDEVSIQELTATSGNVDLPSVLEKDPIAALLPLMEIPISALVRAETPDIQVEGRWYDNQHCPNGRDTYHWLHDGRETVVEEERLEQSSGYFGGGGRRSLRIEGATWAVRVDSGRHLNGCEWTRPGRVVVWDQCDPTALANALAPVVWGNGADANYLEAMKSLEAARAWVSGRFHVEAHPDHPDRVMVDLYDLRLHHLRELQRPHPVSRLVQKHGWEVLPLGDAQQEWLRVKEDLGEAARWVLKTYRVRPVVSGDFNGVKFARLSDPDNFGDINNPYINELREECIKHLMEVHRGKLVDLLFEQAGEKPEVLVPSYHNPSTFWLENGVWWGETYEPRCVWPGAVHRGNGWFKYPLGSEEDLVKVELGQGEFSKNLLRLSGERRQGATSMGGFQGALFDGEECFVRAYEALLPVRVGETKNFMFQIKNEWAYPGAGASVWAVTVTRTLDGVEFKPCDNGKNYTCAGYWGREVSAN